MALTVGSGSVAVGDDLPADPHDDVAVIRATRSLPSRV
jgi:hypothetical protein